MFVGVDRYEDKAFRDLRYSVADAAALAAAFGRYGYETHVATNPGNRALLDEVDRRTAGLGPGDVFVFFFAGHGYTGPGEEHLLICRDDRLQWLRHNRAGVPVDLLEELTNGKGFHRAFLLDACRTDVFSGMEDRGGTETRDLGLVAMPDAGKYPGTCCVLRSCDRFCPALEFEDLGHGVFTRAILDFLETTGERAVPMGEGFAGGVRERMRNILVREGSPMEQCPTFQTNGEAFALFGEGGAMDTVYGGAPRGKDGEVDALRAEMGRLRAEVERLRGEKERNESNETAVPGKAMERERELGAKERYQRKEAPEKKTKQSVNGIKEETGWELQAGERLGKYRVLRPLMRVDMATLYLAEATEGGGAVTLKVLSFNRKTGGPGRVVARFVRAVGLEERIRHAHWVGVHETGYDAERNLYYKAMEAMAGSLAQQLRTRGTFGEGEAIGVVEQIALVLEKTNRMSIVHRDIKPANILYDRNGTYKLTGLEIAKSPMCEEPVPEESVFGTPAYMSPEQVTGRSDIRSDIYSLGTVFFELLSGERPYQGETPVQVLAQVITDKPPPDVRSKPNAREIHPDTAQLIACMMAKNPAERPQTPEELLARLRELSARRVRT